MFRIGTIVVRPSLNASKESAFGMWTGRAFCCITVLGKYDNLWNSVSDSGYAISQFMAVKGGPHFWCDALDYWYCYQALHCLAN